MPANKTQFSRNVKLHLAVGSLASFAALLLIYVLATDQMSFGFNLTTLGVVASLALGLYAFETGRRHHTLDRMWNEMERQTAQRPKPSGRQLTMEERVGLAVRFYGLYTFSIELINAHLEKNPTIRQGRLADLQCGMDNMRVPFSEGQLSIEESQYLDLHAQKFAAEAALYSANDSSP
jgi:hypothetical protein